MGNFSWRWKSHGMLFMGKAEAHIDRGVRFNSFALYATEGHILPIYSLKIAMAIVKVA
jgi:hypothetical protein